MSWILRKQSKKPEKYAVNIAREILAVNTGNYEIIPDLNLGDENGDLWCQSCGNLALSEDEEIDVTDKAYNFQFLPSKQQG